MQVCSNKQAAKEKAPPDQGGASVVRRRLQPPKTIPNQSPPRFRILSDVTWLPHDRHDKPDCATSNDEEANQCYQRRVEMPRKPPRKDDQRQNHAIAQEYSRSHGPSVPISCRTSQGLVAVSRIWLPVTSTQKGSFGSSDSVPQGSSPENVLSVSAIE